MMVIGFPKPKPGLSLSDYLKANQECPFVKGSGEIDINDIKNLPCENCSIERCTIQKINQKQVDEVVDKSMKLVIESYNAVKPIPGIFSKCIVEYTDMLKDVLDSKGVKYTITDDLKKYNNMEWTSFDFYGNIVNDNNVIIAQINSHSLLEYILIYEMSPRGLELNQGVGGGTIPVIHHVIEEMVGAETWVGSKQFMPLIRMVDHKLGKELEKKGIEDTKYGIAFDTKIDPKILNLVFKFENPSNELKTVFGRAIRSDECNITMEGNTLVVPLIDILFYKHTNIIPGMFNKAFETKLPKFSAVLKKNKLNRIVPE